MNTVTGEKEPLALLSFFKMVTHETRVFYSI